MSDRGTVSHPEVTVASIALRPEVIAVLKHPRVHDLTRDIRQQVYVIPYQQPSGQIGLALRTKREAGNASKGVERALHSFGRGIPVFEVCTVAETVSDA